MLHTFLLFCVILFGFASATPSQCYNCDDTSSCNSPIDTSKMKIQECVHETTPDSLFICAKITGLNRVDEEETIRLCSETTLYGQPFCEMSEEILVEFNHWKNVNCTTCDTNLCNNN